MYKYILVSLVIFSGCVTAPKCLTAAQEPVSSCRAQAECRHGGTAAGILLAGFNPTANGRNAAADQYNQCVDNSLRAQSANAGVPSKSVNCQSEETYPGHFETQCH